MKLTFATASDGTPLTKKFTQTERGYSKESYPNVAKVNSLEIVTDGSPDAFYQALKQSAAISACLLTGYLDRELHGESRAGCKLEGQLSDYVVFDLDDLQGVETIEEFVRDFLPVPFHEVSYVAQHSASSGLSFGGIRAHVFFMLAEPTEPAQIKQWLTETNLDNDKLKHQLTLNAGGGSLGYPLDRVANDHGRIVFIAPPICTNFTDPMAGERISLVTKSLGHVEFQFKTSSNKVVRAKERDVITQLRAAASLPTKALNIKQIAGLDVLIDADEVTVDDHWWGNGFIHLNLNGGDSGAYYIDPKRPKYIKNFKGEPVLILQKVASGFYQSIKDDLEVAEMLLFRDKITDTFYAGRYDPIEDKIEELYPIVKSNIKNWANKEFDQDVDMEDIDNYTFEFAPDNKRTVDRSSRFVNRFDPTEYMRLPLDEGVAYEMPTTIGRLLLHICGDDAAVLEWMLNREAVIFQLRRKSQTAMVIQGVPGIGKGFYYKAITEKLYGNYQQSIQLKQQENDLFNTFLTQTLVLHVEESQSQPAMRDQLFHWIADDTISVRRMHREVEAVKTYCNFIFVSNHFDAVQIESDDRRYTVAPYQTEKLLDVFTNEELDVVIPQELSQYARYLLTREANVEKARIPITNQAKEEMRFAAMSTADLFVDAIKRGDLDWLVQRYVEGEATQHSHGMAVKRAMERWFPDVNQGRTPVFKADLFEFYLFITDHDRSNEVQFGKMLTTRGFSIKNSDRVTIDGQRKSGVYIEWKASEETIQTLERLLPGTDRAERAPADVTNIKDNHGHSER